MISLNRTITEDSQKDEKAGLLVPRLGRGTGKHHPGRTYQEKEDLEGERGATQEKPVQEAVSQVKEGREGKGQQEPVHKPREHAYRREGDEHRSRTASGHRNFHHGEKWARGNLVQHTRQTKKSTKPGRHASGGGDHTLIESTNTTKKENQI